MKKIKARILEIIIIILMGLTGFFFQRTYDGIKKLEIDVYQNKSDISVMMKTKKNVSGVPK